MKVTKLFQLEGHRDCIYGLCEGIEPGTIYSGGAEGFVVAWNPQQSADGKLLVKTPAPVYCITLHQGNLLIGTGEGALHVVDIVSGKEIRNIHNHIKGIYCILITDKYIITCGGDGVIGIFDLQLQHIQNLKIITKSCRIAVYENSFLYIGCSDHQIYKINTQDFSIVEAWSGHTSSVFSLEIISQKLISGGRDAHLLVRMIDNGTIIKDIPAHLLHIHQIKKNPSETLIATASMDKTIKIWNAETMDLLKVIDAAKFNGHTSSVNKILWSNNTHLISISDDKKVMGWSLEI